MSVTPEAIEAAARELYVGQNWHTVHAELDEDPAPKSEYKRLAGALWDKGGLGYENAKKYRYLATAALTVAAPFIAAQAKAEALQEAADDLLAEKCGDNYAPNYCETCRAVETLRARAATIEGD